MTSCALSPAYETGAICLDANILHSEVLK